MMMTKKKAAKMIQYVLTVSRNFPAYHPKAGDPTNFVEGIKKAKHWQKQVEIFDQGVDVPGIKFHTIRGNWELWEKRFKKIKKGKACLSIRFWTGKPYKSPQEEIIKLTVEDGIGIQKLTTPKILIDDEQLFTPINSLAKNDGLSPTDFYEWFGKKLDEENEFALIHFTSFRYE